MNGERLVQNIRAISIQKGIPMKELYVKAGITSGALSQWKTGKTKPHVATLDRVARAMNVTIKELMEGTDTEIPASDSGSGEMEEILQTLRSRPEMKMLFDAGRKATPETVRKTARFLEELAKGENSD